MPRYSGSGAAGTRIDIVGLERLVEATGLTAAHLKLAVQEALRGEAGKLLVNEMKARTPMGPGSFGGHTRDDEKVRDLGLRGGVLVGYQGQLSGGNRGGGRLQKGAWLESGTKPHKIEAKREGSGKGGFTTRHALKINGVYRESVQHHGSRALKIADKSLKAAKWDIEDAIVERINEMAEESGWTGGYVGL